MRVSDEEKECIVAYLKAGKSQGWIAKEMKRSKATINGIAKTEGIDTERSATKKATEAAKDYAKAERLLLGNELFNRVRAMVASAATPAQMKDLAITFGTLVDKRRLDDNEPTNIAENRKLDDRRQSLEDYFAQLDEYREDHGSDNIRQPLDTPRPD